MARFSGRQFRGALRVYRLEARARAEVRQAARRERDAIREKQRQPKTIWRTINRKWRT